jgi:hypothetical protein
MKMLDAGISIAKLDFTVKQPALAKVSAGI